MSKLTVLPSILASDFSCLAKELKRCEEAGASGIHIDIMDGHFVPNLSMGPAIVSAIKRSTSLFLDVHLMTYNPYGLIEEMVKCGADRITFHMEATEDVLETLEFIKRCVNSRKEPVQAGLAFSPETSASLIPKYLDACDMILLMTVHPGFGGQEFLPEVLEKIRFTVEVMDKIGVKKPIQVDGGINPQTAKECLDAGASSLVAGSYLFKQKEMVQGIKALRQGI